MLQLRRTLGNWATSATTLAEPLQNCKQRTAKDGEAIKILIMTRETHLSGPKDCSTVDPSCREYGSRVNKEINLSLSTVEPSAALIHTTIAVWLTYVSKGSLENKQRNYYQNFKLIIIYNNENGYNNSKHKHKLDPLKMQKPISASASEMSSW